MARVTSLSHIDAPTGTKQPIDIEKSLVAALPIGSNEHAELWRDSSQRDHILQNQHGTEGAGIENWDPENVLLNSTHLSSTVYRNVLHFMEDWKKFSSIGRFRVLYIPSANKAVADVYNYPYVDRESVKQEIYGLMEEAGTENWDGEGALALDIKTVEIAQKLVDEFPGHVIRPDIAATPHGEVDFDWTISREVMLTVSVCPSGEIAFAGLFQDARLNGREPWMGSLPQFVGCCFERLREFQDQ